MAMTRGAAPGQAGPLPGMTVRAVLRQLWPVVAVVGLLMSVSLAAAHTSLRFTEVEQAVNEAPTLPEYSPPDSPPPRPREVAPVESGGLPEWLVTVAQVAGGLMVATVVGLLLWVVLRDLLAGTRRRRATARPPGVRPAARTTTNDVVAALDAGLVELDDSDTDPRRAVIACWVRLEQAAAAAGIPRQVGDTPTDLVSRLLSSGSHRVSADVLAAFAHVYREARYATHRVDERMRDQARSALARLRNELTAEVSG